MRVFRGDGSRRRRGRDVERSGGGGPSETGAFRRRRVVRDGSVPRGRGVRKVHDAPPPVRRHEEPDDRRLEDQVVRAPRENQTRPVEGVDHLRRLAAPPPRNLRDEPVVVVPVLAQRRAVPASRSTIMRISAVVGGSDASAWSSGGESRRRRGHDVDIPRSGATDAAATTWIFRGRGERRRGHDVDIPRAGRATEDPGRGARRLALSGPRPAGRSLGTATRRPGGIRTLARGRHAVRERERQQVARRAPEPERRRADPVALRGRGAVARELRAEAHEVAVDAVRFGRGAPRRRVAARPRRDDVARVRGHKVREVPRALGRQAAVPTRRLIRAFAAWEG